MLDSPPGMEQPMRVLIETPNQRQRRPLFTSLHRNVAVVARLRISDHQRNQLTSP